MSPKPPKGPALEGVINGCLVSILIWIVLVIVYFGLFHKPR